MYPTTGYWKELSEEKKRKNELETVRQLVKEHPENTYWKNMLEELEAKNDPRTPAQIEMDEMAEDKPWRWDWTPYPKDMPIIDIDGIEEVEF